MGIGLLALAVVLPALDPRLAPSFAPLALPQAVTYAVSPDLPAAAPAPTVADVGSSAPAPSLVSDAPQKPDATPAPRLPGRIALPPVIGVALLWAFLAAVAAGVARLAIGLMAAGRLLRRSSEIELPPAVLAPMRRLATAHGRKAIPVRASNDLMVPAAVGGLTPTILVPADFERHGEEAMIAALLHECAHVVRGDYAINLACEAMTVPLIWHPAVHLIKSQVQADRETACDRLASSQMPAKRYASCLVALADAMSPAPRAALAMQTLFGRGELERRVRVLLQAPSGEMPGRLLRAALMGGPALAAVVASGLVFHVEPAMAQAAQAMSAPAQVATPARAAISSTPAAPASMAAVDAAPIPPTPAKPRAHKVVEHEVHRWTSDDGKTHIVIADDERDLTPEEQAKLDTDLAKARADADKARAYVHSPEFRATIDKAQREATGAAVAQARAEAEAARADARAHSEEMRAQIHDMVERQRVMIDNNRVEVAAQVRRVKEILHDPDVEKALEQAKAAGPEVRRALDRLDRELDRVDYRIPAPPKPPKPPAPPAPPPAPPPPPPPEAP
jgi:beta-lactamase regulating signal transducer with metallopeptidase domain